MLLKATCKQILFREEQNFWPKNWCWPQTLPTHSEEDASEQNRENRTNTSHLNPPRLRRRQRLPSGHSLCQEISLPCALCKLMSGFVSSLQKMKLGLCSCTVALSSAGCRVCVHPGGASAAKLGFGPHPGSCLVRPCRESGNQPTVTEAPQGLCSEVPHAQHPAFIDGWHGVVVWERAPHAFGM